MTNTLKGARALAVLLALVLVAAACGSDDSTDEASDSSSASETADDTSEDAGSDSDESAASDEAGSGDPVPVCELAYYTGEFGALGPSLTADVTFPVEEVINTDPPLGRPWQMFSEDLGTVGEAQAARACLERHNAEIVVSIAHGYRTYRDFMMEYWAENDSPIVPSVHGGAIPGNLGGKGGEPIFRAQGLDEGLGTSGILYAESIGAQNVVIFATQVEGFQLAADAAEAAADSVGIEILDRINAAAEQPSYRAEVERIVDLEPDAVIVQAGTVESGTLIKQAAEAGLSLEWIGETGWVQPEFIGTLGADLVETQEGIGFAAFSYDDTTPAWDFFADKWESTPGYGDEFGPATDLYHFSTYDVMVHTALAVEAAGSYSASAWAPAMYEVGSAPGEVCYTYADCLALIRDGQDIDYEGITGSGDYTEGGVNNVTAAYTPFADDGTTGTPVILDPARSLEIVDSIAAQAECDADSPPNACEW
ncbi:MAG: ABC transporter substrate-binding protein [Actinomycetota bacterium]